MADGKLVFPIRFDLDSAVKAATGDIDRVLRRMQTMILHQPLQMRIAFDESRAGTSIDSIRDRMNTLIETWNRMAKSQKYADDSLKTYSARALDIIHEFASLTAQTRTHARTLEELQRASDKAVASQERDWEKKQKLIAKSQERVAVLNAEETSLTAVAAKQKAFQQIADSADFGTSKYIYATQQVERLGAQYQRLLDIMNRNTGNKGKDQFGLEKLKETLRGPEDTIERVKAKMKALNQILSTTPPDSYGFRRATDEAQRLIPILDELKRKQKEATTITVNISGMPEKTIADLTAKIQAYRNVMQNSDFGSREFNNAMWAVSGLTTKLEQMNQKVAEWEKWRTFQQAIANAANTIDSLNARITAWQTRLNGLEVGSAKWLEAAENVARLSRELQQATQWAQDFQQKAFQGLSSPILQKKVEETQQLRNQLQTLTEQFNRLQSAGLATDKDGNFTAKAVDILKQRGDILSQIAAKTRDADSAQDSYKKKLAEEEAELKRLMDAEAKRKKHLQDALNVMQANETRVDGLNQKLQRYQQILSKLSVGSDAWNRTALEIRRITEELARCNQRMQDFQQKSFQGLGDAFTQQQVERLTSLRREIETLDARIHEIQQRGANGYALSADKAQMNSLLDQRIAKEKQIAEITKSAADLMLEREKEINAELAKRKTRIDEINRKNKEQQTAYAAKRRAGLETQKMLNAEENSINNIQKKLAYYQNKLNGQKLDSNGFLKTAQEIERLTKLLEDAQKKVDALTGKAQTGAGRQERAYNRINEQLRKQSSYLERLTQRMMIYASIGAIGGFLTKIREVTAQFELQRISLGAIIQDQNKANQLFSEIKQFALKSPVSILDLTKYTKQVAAYRIETDKLFDTTKRLADVSVGLGVDMGRIVLAYGQVRAASYLRAAEIRQFTEAGIPMLELLSEKFTKLNGEMVTTEQVMDLVSKRGVSFQMVEEIFNDMTSAGGMFYNMQERQGNTLYGMWQKLGDAASVMYDQIGNTGFVNSSMKTLIEASTDLMRNWKAAGFAGATFAAILAVLAVRNRAMLSGTKLKELADQRAAAATERREKAEERLHAAQANGTTQERIAATAAKQKAVADEQAAIAAQKRAQSQNALSSGLKSMGSSMMNFVGYGIALTAVTTLIYKLREAYDNAHRLKDALNETWSETSVLQVQSARNFEMLAEKVRKSVDGSKAQKDALDELQRTYKDMLPEEALKIENLRAMKGNYDELTQAVCEYIAAQQEQKALNQVNEEEGAVQTKMQKKIREVMIDKKLGTLALSEEEVQRFFIIFRKTALDESKTVKEQFVEAFRLAGIDGAEEMWEKVKKKAKDFFVVNPGAFGDEDSYVKGGKAIGELSESIRRQTEQIEGQRKAYAGLTADLGVYTREMMDYNEWVEKNLNSGETFVQAQDNLNMRIRGMERRIREAMKNAGVAWQSAWSDVVENVDANDLNHVTWMNMESIIEAIDPNKYPELARYVRQYRKIYYDLVPQDTTVQQIRAKMFQIADATGAGMEAMRRFLWDGSGDVDSHLKYLNEQIEQYEANLKKMQTTVANNGILGTIANFFLAGKIEETTEILSALKQQAEFVKTYTVDKSKDKGSKNDTRLQELQEINQTLEKINKEYSDLEKREGRIPALEDIAKQFKATLEYTNKLGKKFGLAFDYPTEFENLQKYRNEILKVMKSLKNLKGGDKAILEFQTMIAKADSDEFQKQMDRMLKDIQEKIARTKTAKEFFEKILAQTGDEELAVRITYSVYPETGRDLYTDVQDQIRRIFRTGDTAKDNLLRLRLDAVFDDENERIDYRELDRVYAEYQNDIIEKNRDTARKLITEGQKTAASNIATWEKELAKAKDFEEQRTDIINRETQRRAEIYKSNLPQDEKDRLAEQSRSKQGRDLAELDVKEFRESDGYVEMFENMADAGTKSLERLRDRIREVLESAKEASPATIKQLMQALTSVEAELEGRNPFAEMTNGMRDMFKAIGELKRARTELKAAQAEFNAASPMLEANLLTAMNEQATAEQELNRLRSSGLATQNEIVTAELRLNAATANVAKAEERKKAAKKKLQSAQDGVNKAESKANKSQNKFIKGVDVARGAVENVKTVLEGLEPIFGDLTSEATTMGDVFTALVSAAQTFTAIMEVVIVLQEAFNIASESNPWMAIAAAVLAVSAALAGFFSAQKVKKANREIERQQEILDELAYTYERLQTAADKLFGADWLGNFNQQEKALRAEAEAYRKQAEAERSKGKKEDKEKTKEYEQSYRDTMDAIADMYGKVSEKMFGSDLASTARDFAQAWLDAYKEFGNTADAMSTKFKDMIENMVVEGALARVMERALQPMFDMIDNMGESDFYSSSFWSKVVAEAEKGADAANFGAATMMKFLESAGINIRELGGELTGISREVGNATSEEINTWGAALNTQNFYIAQQLAEVRGIRAWLEGGGVVSPSVPAIDYTELQNTAIGHLAAIERHTAETVTECRNIASRCEEQTKLIRRVITSSGQYQGVNVIMRKG